MGSLISLRRCLLQVNISGFPLAAKVVYTVVFCARPTHSVVKVSQFVLAAMKVVRPMMETGQTQTWLLQDGIWVKSGPFRAVAAVPGMLIEMKVSFAAMPVAVAVVAPAATAFAVLLPGLRSGPALASDGQGPPCFQGPHFDRGAAATPACDAGRDAV